MNDTSAVTGFGIAWDAEWIGPDRLRVLGWQSVNGLSALATWDVDALIATIDGALEAAGWSDRDREAARQGVLQLYKEDLNT